MGKRFKVERVAEIGDTECIAIKEVSNDTERILSVFGTSEREVTSGVEDLENYLNRLPPFIARLVAYYLPIAQYVDREPIKGTNDMLRKFLREMERSIDDREGYPLLSSATCRRGFCNAVIIGESAWIASYAPAYGKGIECLVLALENAPRKWVPALPRLGKLLEAVAEAIEGRVGDPRDLAEAVRELGIPAQPADPFVLDDELADRLMDWACRSGFCEYANGVTVAAFPLYTPADLPRVGEGPWDINPRIVIAIRSERGTALREIAVPMVVENDEDAEFLADLSRKLVKALARMVENASRDFVWWSPEQLLGLVDEFLYDEEGDAESLERRIDELAELAEAGFPAEAVEKNGVLYAAVPTEDGNCLLMIAYTYAAGDRVGVEVLYADEAGYIHSAGASPQELPEVLAELGEDVLNALGNLLVKLMKLEGSELASRIVEEAMPSALETS